MVCVKIQGVDVYSEMTIFYAVEEYLRKSLHLATAGRPLIFLDTETTGLILGGAQPIAWQIGYVRRTSRKPGSEEQASEADLNIGEFLSPEVCNICHVPTDHPMRRGRNPIEVLERFAERLDGAIPVGHNYDKFDYQILRFTYERYHLPMPAELRHAGIGYSIDTLILAQMLMAKGAPGSPENNKNSTLANHFKVPYEQTEVHSALADSKITMGVFDHLIDMCQQQFCDELFLSEVKKRAAQAPK